MQMFQGTSKLISVEIAMFFLLNALLTVLLIAY